MIPHLIQFSLRQRFVVVCAAVILALAGWYAFTQLDIEAYPDPVQPMIEVLAQPDGLSAEEVEQEVTVPLETGLAAMRNLQSIASISLFGLSDIKCFFSWDSDYYWDRIETSHALAFVPLPGVAPFISPENPVGEIYRYTVDLPSHDLMAESELENWVVARRLKTVPGVIDVTSFGGLTRQYQVDVDPQKLDYYQVSLPSLISALRNSNINVGGGYLPIGEQAFDVRGLGLIQSPQDIATVRVGGFDATPVYVGNLAQVHIGYAPRLGQVTMNRRGEVVEGIVQMRKYGNSRQTLRGIEAAVAQLNGRLAVKGGAIHPYYDRLGLIKTTVSTVTGNLSLGMALVFLVLVFFICEIRPAAITAINIPLALLGAAILIYLSGTPANLMSLGAIDFGIIVDSTVIVMENIHRHLEQRAPGTPTHAIIMRAGSEVGRPILFSTMIFVVAFMPLFTMRAIEGAIFSPMSHVYAFALAVGILLAVTLAPALSRMLLRAGPQGFRNPLWEALKRAYHRLFVWSLARPRLALALMVVAIVAGLAQFPRLGGEFMPHLEEGNLLVHATLPLSISFQHGAEIVGRLRQTIEKLPEAQDVVAQYGRPNDGTDSVGFENSDILINLKPVAAWRPSLGQDKERLVEDLDRRLRRSAPGVDFDYSQFVEDRVEDVMSGIKGSDSLDIFGPELATDEGLANRIATFMAKVPGVQDVLVNRSLGKPNLLIAPDRAACARYGLNVGDVNAVIGAALGGQAVSSVLKGDRTYDLVVRWMAPYRQSLDAIRQIRVPLPGGGLVPLGQVASVRSAEGASFIYREGFRRYVPISFSVRGRDLQSTVDEAQLRIAQNIKLPPQIRLRWGGEYGELQAALRRLYIMVPAALLLSAGLLYAATGGLADTLIVMAQIPVACLGGILALIVAGKPFSISAAVGFISVFGIAMTDGILLSTYIQQLWAEGHDFTQGIVMGSDRRFRAVIMTALVDGLGLLPAALSQRIGAQPQKPLAIVVIGGVLAIAALTRILQPVLIYLFHPRGRQLQAVPDFEEP